MKTSLNIILAALCLGLCAPTLTGCATATRTHEAVIYDNFRSTYAAAKTAYMGYLELVVQGQVSIENEARADQAWNDFRAAFAVAFKVASNDWNAATPGGVQALADELIKLVRNL